MTLKSKQKPVDIQQPEKIIFERAPASLPGSFRGAVTRDPELPDGPYRTLHLYADYARDKATPSVAEAAKVRGKSARTLFKHRRKLVALGYLKIIRDEAGNATLTICNPARISRLTSTVTTLFSGKPTGGEKQGGAEPNPPPANEQELLQKLKRIRPDFHAAGGRKLLQAYDGQTPIGDLLDQWVANRRYIPANWRVGMVYREIEAGNPPPASPLLNDPDMAAAFAAGERHAAEVAGE